MCVCVHARARDSVRVCLFAKHEYVAAYMEVNYAIDTWTLKLTLHRSCTEISTTTMSAGEC